MVLTTGGTVFISQSLFNNTGGTIDLSGGGSVIVGANVTSPVSGHIAVNSGGTFVDRGYVSGFVDTTGTGKYYDYENLDGSVDDGALFTIEADGPAGFESDVRAARASVHNATASTGITLSGDLTVESDGVLDMVIAGSDPGDYAHLTVAGTTTVAGTVLLDFQNGFAPQTGQTFDLFTISDGSSIAGDIQVAGLEPGWDYSVQQESGDTIIDSLGYGVATSPEPSPVVLGMALFAGSSLRRPQRSRRGGRATSVVSG
jgi:hypothetical protein